jgi:2-acylglycerol O-acyltransferase 2
MKNFILKFESFFQVALVVGGAREALHARPGDYKLILNNRKGFCRIAIQTGAFLVPVFSFGEIEIFDQKPNDPGTKIRAFQEFVKRWTGVSPVLMYGRGFSPKHYGIIPHRQPITTIIGAPIEVTQNKNPSTEEIDILHATFVDSIQKLFHDHKHKYVKNPEGVKLIID